jgi:Undecaprenyl-phosphate glucose phosphotransferase
VRYSKYISTIAAIGDFIILNLLFVFFFLYSKHFSPESLQERAILFYIYINLAWVISISIFKPYKIERQGGKKYILFSYIKMVIFLLPLFLLYFQVLSFNYFPREQIKYLFPFLLISFLLWRFGLYYLLILYRKAGYNYRNVIIVGNDATAKELGDFFKQNQWTGYRFKGYFAKSGSNKKEEAGSYDDIEKFVEDYKIDEIYLISGDIHEDIYKVIASVSGKFPVKIKVVPVSSNLFYKSIKLVNYDNIPVLTFQEGPLSFWYNRFFKRLFDITFSLIIIITVLTWLTPLIFIINIISGDKESLFFIQKRTGMDNKPFSLIKFRTMKENSLANIEQATKNDNRVTRIGKFLRKSSIDEMPQFINVLKGDMSVVGPRPHMLKHTKEYKETVKRFMVRHVVKPGITGYAQVRGYRGEIKKACDIENRIKMDLFYIENWTFSLDIKIIFLTIFHILKGESTAY